MKRLTATMLFTVMVLSLFSPTAFAAGVYIPVISGLKNGQSVNEDVKVTWDEIQSADYYTVALRYIQNGTDGPLVYDSVKTEGAEFVIKASDLQKHGRGAYRICIASHVNGKPHYSDVINFVYTDVISPLTGKTIVCFGDSLTANGYWETLLSNRFGVSFINAGKGGDTTETAKARFEKEVLSRKPDLTLICFGYNDAVKMSGDIPADLSRVSLVKYKENLTHFVSELKAIGSEVLLFSPNMVNEEYFNANPKHPGEGYVADGGINALVRQYIAVMKKVAKEQNVMFCDLNKAFEGKDLYTYISKDGTHPSTTGYTLYARVLGDFLEQEYSNPVFMLGDINGNGKIDATDYMMCKRIYLGTYIPDQRQATAADVNKNGKPDATDYMMIKRCFLGTYIITE